MVYGQVGRRRLEHDPFRHGKFIIKYNDCHTFLTMFCEGKYLKKSLKFNDLGIDIIERKVPYVSINQQTRNRC